MVAEALQLLLQFIEVIHGLQDKLNNVLRKVNVPIDHVLPLFFLSFFYLPPLLHDLLSIPADCFEELFEVDFPIGIVVASSKHGVNVVLSSGHAELVEQDPEVLDGQVSLPETQLPELTFQLDRWQPLYLF